MVQYLKRLPSTQERFGQAFMNAGEAAGKAYTEHLRLKEEDQALKKRGIDLEGVTSPQTRQALMADDLIYGRRAKQAEGSQNVDYNIDRSPEGRQQFLEENKVSNQKLPEFAEKPKEMQNRNIMQLGETNGNLPQPETAGQKKEVLSPPEVRLHGARIARERTINGTPTSVEEGIKIAQSLNADNEAYNAKVDADTEQRVRSQQIYGDKAVEQFNNVLPDATAEQVALFKRKGEETAGKFKSEALIERHLAQEAVKFKNNIASIKNSIGPNRIGNKIYQKLLGNERDAEKAMDDVRIKLKPLLDQGLYDTARNLLSELGYHPEEREKIVSSLGENANKVISQISPVQKLAKNDEHMSERRLENLPENEKTYSKQDYQKINDTIRNVIKSDPSVNLILLRKSLEDKNINWIAYKDALNDAIFKGEIELNDDQVKQLDTLEQPPLNNLEKILYDLNLIGR